METHSILDKMLHSNPLILFSVYTDIQSKTVRELGREVLESLDSGITPNPDIAGGIICSTEVTHRGYGQFWLWILAAYEVVRTMCQAEKCFSPHLAGELKELKQKLATLRIPFAKQELPGQKSPVGGEPSIAGINLTPPDILFQVKGQVLSARTLISEFAAVFQGISRGDIVASHRALSPEKLLKQGTTDRQVT